MKQLKVFFRASLLLLVSFIIVACGNQNSNNASTTNQDVVTNDEEPTAVKVGMGTEDGRIMWEEIGERLLEHENIEIEPVVINDFYQLNRALSDGDIDMNLYQYISFLAQYNEDAGTELRPIGYGSIPPIAIFANESIESIDDIPDGARVSFTDDPVNIDNSLIQLKTAGLIEVEEVEGERLSIDKITNNPKNLEFIPLEGPEVARSLATGDVDVMITGLSMANDAGFKPEDALYIEDTDKTPYYYQVMMVTNKNRVDDEVLKTVVDYYQSEETVKSEKARRGDAYVPAWHEGETPLEDYDKYVRDFMNK